MIVLDTDVLTIVQRAGGQEYKNLALRLDTADDDVAVTIVSFEEQMRGWLAFISRARTSSQLMQGYSRLRFALAGFTARPVLDFDQACGAELERLVRSKVRIGTMDLRIAAISIAHDALLISRNLRDFRKVPGLQVEDWTASPPD